MKAAISYTCRCGADLLLCVTRNEDDATVDEWRDTVQEIGRELGVDVVDQRAVSFACPRCGEERPVAAVGSEVAGDLAGTD